MTETGPEVFPDPLPEWVTSNHRRNAEVRVYDALKSQLAHPWHIFYSRPWIGLDPNGLERDGEADFVVAHPDLGILVIEVKGGRVGREPKTEKWFSVDADGDKFLIKDPVKQAVASKHRLLEKLRKLPGWNGRWVTARHAVVFPSCTKPSQDLGPDMPTWIFAGHETMEALGDWVENRLEEHFPNEPLSADSLDYDGVDIMREYFSGSILLERPVGASLVTDDEKIRIMTDQQACILDVMESVIRLAIPGPAGTGKTALAVEKARRLAKAGKRTLLTCYSRPLAKQLARELDNVPGVVVRSFHSICVEMATKAAIKTSGGEGSTQSEYFAVELPTALKRAMEKLPAEAFDAVVVDEGQDFHETWASAVDALLKKPNTCPLIVFFDDNQKVFGKAHSLASNVPTNGLRLTRILRNSKTIVDAIQTLIPKPFLSAGPHGQPVEWIESAGLVSYGGLGILLKQLIEKRGIAARNIAVVVSDERTRDSVVQGGRIGDYFVDDAEASAGKSVVCDSIRRFKGLERQAVVLVDPQRVIGDPEALYVGLTRARVLLVLAAEPGRLDQLRILLS